MDDEDPFQLRLTFKTLLEKLTASQQSVGMAANFAMKHKHLHQDLYNCVTEHIDMANPLERVNLLYVLDMICNLSRKHKFPGYIDLLKPDLLSVVRAVVPEEDGRGAVNIPNVKKVVHNWKTKSFFTEQDLEPVEQYLESKSFIQVDKHQTASFTKGEIMKRIEEDRERSKRIREEMWVKQWPSSSELFNRNVEKDVEFIEAWESVSDYNDDDFQLLMIENEKAALSF